MKRHRSKKVRVEPSKLKRKKHMTDITVDELKENIANILAGQAAQNGFRKTFMENVVRKQVTDITLADALVAELNAGFDKGDMAFDVAAKAEAEEVDLPPSEDAGDLIKDLFTA